MIDRISSFAAPAQRQFLLEAMQTQLNQLTNEVSSGTKTNPAGAMGANAGLLYRLHMDADQHTALQTAATSAGNQLDAIQGALTSMDSVVQAVATATVNVASATGGGETAIATQAQSAMSQVLGLLNTQYNGKALFAGDATGGLPMQAADAPNGPLAAGAGVLSAAVAAKGGPLSQSDISGLLTGPNGLASVFDDTNANPSARFSGAFYTATDDGKPSKVPISGGQTVQYDIKGNQPAFRDLLKGLSMLSMLNAPSSQLDDSAKTELLKQAGTVINQAQTELTAKQGELGVTQARLQNVVDMQTAAGKATTTQILGYEQADTYGDAEKLTSLQTQMQASYAITAQISQLSLVHYLPSLTG
jgi:flagellar hook-associated protein 3 FlgL